LVDRDVFDLQNTNNVTAMQNPPQPNIPPHKAFDFPRSGEKVEAFMDWFNRQVDRGILQVSEIPQIGRAVEEAWTDKYIRSAYQQGIERGRQELINAGYEVPDLVEQGGMGAVFNQPFHLETVGLLYTRSFRDLKGITNAMDQQISRVLAQGMADGRNPRELAKLLNRTISGPVGDLALTDTLGRFIPAERRAEILARTEIIRAHHMATMQEYKNWGAVGVQVIAEWQTAGDSRVCARCRSLNGQFFEIEEIESMIPRHPQCRCVALPVDRETFEEIQGRT
jgi:SPP1 gp7 family putative phage head morphogenesis protein